MKKHRLYGGEIRDMDVTMYSNLNSVMMWIQKKRVWDCKTPLLVEYIVSIGIIELINQDADKYAAHAAGWQKANSG